MLPEMKRQGELIYEHFSRHERKYYYYYSAQHENPKSKIQSTHQNERTGLGLLNRERQYPLRIYPLSTFTV